MPSFSGLCVDLLVGAPFGFYKFFDLSTVDQYINDDSLCISIDIKILSISSYYRPPDFVIPKHLTDSNGFYNSNKEPTACASEVEVALDRYMSFMEFHDVIIKVTENERLGNEDNKDNCFRIFYGHRLTLSAASDFFSALFTSDFGDGTKKEVTIFSVDPYVFGRLLYYIYVDMIEFKCVDDAKELFLAADYLQLPKVVSKAQLYLQMKVSPLNIWSSWKWAVACGCDKMDEYYKECFCLNAVLLLSQPEWLLADFSIVSRVLSIDNLSESVDEKIFYQSLIDWRKHQLEEEEAGRRNKDNDGDQQFGLLLKKVRFPMIKPISFFNVVEEEPLVIKAAGIHELVYQKVKSLFDVKPDP
ncbi:hypothetical protein F4703DRAFT_1933073 [Phycomyces blakesleeanus]